MGKDRSGFILQLNSDDMKVAKKDLGEDPKQVASHVGALRDWLKQQHHFRTRDDEEFLLTFLRQAKFSQIRAREVLEKYSRNRVTPPYKDVYTSEARIDDKTMALLQAGIAFPLPGLDKSGIRTIIFRPGQVDASKYNFIDVLRACLFNIECLLLDPVTQVNGLQYVADHESVSMKYFTLLTPSAMKVCAAACMDTLPVRFRALHLYKAPMIISGAVALLKACLSEKIASRIQNHWNDIKPLQKLMDKKSLPNELGGTAGSYDVLSQMWIQHAQSQVKYFSGFSCVQYDESKKPKDGGVPTGAFRKLNVD